MRFSVAEVAEATGGRLTAGDREAVIEGAAVDSRRLRPGQLFVPLRAARDGHGFIASAVAAGAPAYLTEQPRGSRGTGKVAQPGVIEVDDTLAALAQLGAAARSRLAVPVVGITGSSGKTTTKDLCAAALGSGCWAAEGSFNNEIGLPLTLVDAPETAGSVVCEMGSRGVGHLDHLCAIARPDIGVVTTVGVAHLELFGSPENVARAKAELPAALPADGVAVLPAGDPWLPVLRERCRARVLLFELFGREAGADLVAERASGADLVAERVAFDDRMRPCFRLRSPWGTVSVRLAVVGPHQVGNALAAAGAALAAGRPLEAVAEGISQPEGPAWRMELSETPSGILVVNDAYNSNPQSLGAALDTLAGLAAAGRRPLAVLGEMAELGRISADAHVQAGTRAAAVPGLAALVVVGEGARLIAEGARQAGRSAIVVDDPDQAGAVLEGLLAPGDVVLVKGSRVAGLEALAEKLSARP